MKTLFCSNSLFIFHQTFWQSFFLIIVIIIFLCNICNEPSQFIRNRCHRGHGGDIGRCGHTTQRGHGHCSGHGGHTCHRGRGGYRGRGGGMGRGSQKNLMNYAN